MNGIVWQAKGLVLSYPSRDGGTEAFTHVDFDISAGEFVVLKGPSGSGKSSLLYCLVGLLTPTEGSLQYRNVDVTRWSSKRWAHLRRTEVKFMPQIPAIIPYLTVREALNLPAKDEKSMANTHRLLDRFDMMKHQDYYPHQLSVGGRQRFSFIRAMATPARAVILDEPTASLDDVMTQYVIEELTHAANSGTCVIVATHDPRVQSENATILYMEKGQLKRRGLDL